MKPIRLKRKQALVMAAVAGISVGIGAPASAEEKKTDVQCYGVNGCGQHAKCAVSVADLDAVKALLGAKEYRKRFGKSEAHSCGAHAKCGASANILNWQPTSAQDCHDRGGFLIEESGTKKTAKKA